MPSSKAIIAAAGSRKTSYIVEDALCRCSEEILIVTFTIENLSLIKRYFIERVGHVPGNVKIQSWFSFLLQDGVRPYRNVLYPEHRVETICFVQGMSAAYVPETNVESHYFFEKNKIYTDKLSKFSIRCNEATQQNLVIKRLEGIYDHIYIDEVQDLAGYDLEILELLFRSCISVTVVGDTRQATYFTNCSPKFKKYKGKNILSIFELWESQRLCTIEFRNDCHRGNAAICEFADRLYPDLPKTISKNQQETGHDGVFIVGSKLLKAYVDRFNPMVLRERIDSNTLGHAAMNFGLSKGQTFDRVLIFPNGPMVKFIEKDCTGTLADKTRANFYVAVTRAKYSVAIYIDKDMPSRILSSLTDDHFDHATS
jgi:DNA helicase-2/ATP-dependent DNA helicase PcrA